MDSKPSKGGLAEAPDDRKEAGSTSTRGSVDGPGAVELLFSGVDFFTPATNPSQGVKPLEHKDDEPDENSTESEASGPVRRGLPMSELAWNLRQNSNANSRYNSAEPLRDKTTWTGTRSRWAGTCGPS